MEGTYVVAIPPVGNGISRGYIEARDKEKIRNRLKRIEGQVRAVRRMACRSARSRAGRASRARS